MSPFDHDLEKTSVPDLLRRAAQFAPQRGVNILDRRGNSSGRRTYPELLASVEASAQRLIAMGVKPQERVLICLTTSFELLEAWLGAVFAGAYPVMVAPPGALGGGAAHALKLQYLCELLDPRAFICDGTTRNLLNEFNAAETAKRSTLPEELAKQTPAGAALPTVSPRELAFLQLTSGSTGRQRAVMISHRNVVHNTRGILDFLQGEASDTVVSWLPLHHDMGLVGCTLFAFSRGFDLVLMRPDSFLARPQLWLQIISAHPNVMSPAPNFAYQLCVERADPSDLKLDLSRWNTALTGAEMIRPETCNAFVDKFAAHGFKKSAYFGSYGMAETTLAAASDMKRKGIRLAPMPPTAGAAREMKDVVCCGQPIVDCNIRIYSPAAPHTQMTDGTVGEIWFSGPSLFQGYYNDPAATNEALITQDGATWLRTGDLGFMKDGELYVTGRIKELLIINGHNLMPHELEWHAELASGSGGTERCGAFSVSRDEKGEQAVLVLEVANTDKEHLTNLERDIRTRVGQTTGLPLADMVFLKRGQIPKTTSGKVQRRELKQRYLEGRLERL